MAEGEGTLVLRDEPRLDRRTRGALIRKVVLFQVKLALDGIKDVVLSPLVLIALFFDIFKPSREPGRNLGRVFRAGLVFEEWLDLYAPARDPDVERAQLQVPLAGGFDEGLEQVERVLKEQLEAGHINEKAKSAVEGIIARIDGRVASPSQGDGEDERSAPRS